MKSLLSRPGRRARRPADMLHSADRSLRERPRGAVEITRPSGLLIDEPRRVSKAIGLSRCAQENLDDEPGDESARRAGLFAVVAAGLLGWGALASGAWAAPLNPMQFQSLGPFEAGPGTYTIDTTHGLWLNPDGSGYFAKMFNGIAVFTFDSLSIPLSTQGFSRNTQLFNYTGHPALALPVGTSSAGLPVSMQLVGRFFDDPLLMRVARAYQHATDWDKIIGVHA